MKILKEEINLDTLKYKDIDPHGEENWDEYEIRSGDNFYIFGIYNDNLFMGIAKTTLKSDAFILNIKDCTDKDLNDISVQIRDEVKRNVNANQYDNTKIGLNKNAYIISLVHKPKFIKFYNNIHETVRRELYNIIKTKQNDNRNSENEMDKLEDNVIKLKRSLKSHDEFPGVDEIKLGDNDYIVMKNVIEKNNVTVDLSLAELSSEPDEKGGYNLINKENGQKIVYIKGNFDKLKTVGYLQLKSQKDDNVRTFITRDKEIYTVFINKIIVETNEEIKIKIEKMRKTYNELLKTVRESRNNMENIRNKYMDFDFENFIKKFKKK